MKRDIWAAITFLVTGLLFYLAQASPPAEAIHSDLDSAREDVVMEGKQASRDV